MVKVTFDIEIDRTLPRCVGKGDNAGDRSFLDPGRMDGGQGWDKSSDIKGVNNGYLGGCVCLCVCVCVFLRTL